MKTKAKETTTTTTTTTTMGAALIAANAQAAVKVPENFNGAGHDIPEKMQAASAAGAILIEILEAMKEAELDFFGAAIDFILQGVTFEDMEAAQPELMARDNKLPRYPAYHSAKSCIRKAVANAISLIRADGSPKSKGELTRETANKAPAKNKSGARPPVAKNVAVDDTGEKPEMSVSETVAAEHDAYVQMFDALLGDAKLRERFEPQIKALALATANDSAKRKAAIARQVDNGARLARANGEGIDIKLRENAV